MVWSRYFKWCLVGLVVLAGCTEFPDCQDPRVPFARVGFNTKADKRAVNVSFDEVRAVGVSTPLYVGDTLHTFHLHLDPTDTVTTFLFTYRGFSDTLALSYKSKMVLLTPECGPLIYYYDLRLLQSSFDSTVLVSQVADLNRPPNVQVYF